MSQLELFPPLLNVPMRSDEAVGVMFWQHKDDFGNSLQHCNRLTVHTPHWCRKHGWAHAGRCLACEKES